MGAAASSYPIKSQPLTFTNGTATIPNLPAREAAFFTVEVPSSAKTWSLQAAPAGSGEVSLAIRRGEIPASGIDYYNSIGRDGVILRNPGTELYYERGPSTANTVNLPAGTYHIAAISAGTSPLDANRVGIGTASFEINSVSDIPVTVLGGGAALGTTPQSQAVSLTRGELKLYSFNVASGTLSVEVRLNDRFGGPAMAVARGEYPSFGFGLPAGGVTAVGGALYGGASASAAGSELATLVNPAPGIHTVTVASNAGASATLSAVARPPKTLRVLSFDPQRKLFIAAGDLGKFGVSDDGADWTWHTIDGGRSIRGAEVMGNTYVALQRNASSTTRAISLSQDGGVSWVHKPNMPGTGEPCLNR